MVIIRQEIILIIAVKYSTITLTVGVARFIMVIGYDLKDDVKIQLKSIGY
jgi:hypothetical protein